MSHIAVDLPLVCLSRLFAVPLTEKEVRTELSLNNSNCITQADSGRYYMYMRPGVTVLQA